MPMPGDLAIRTKMGGGPQKMATFQASVARAIKMENEHAARKRQIEKKLYKDDAIGFLVQKESRAFKEDYQKAHDKERTVPGARAEYERRRKMLTKGLSKKKRERLEAAMAARRQKEYSENWRRNRPEDSY